MIDRRAARVRAPDGLRTNGRFVPFLVLACALNCRGAPRKATAGAASAVPSGQPPTAVAVDVCVAEKRSCALASDGRVACWGDNSYQWLSETAEPQVAAPVELAELAPAANLQCPSIGVCVRSRAGAVSCRAENHRTLLRPTLPAPALDFVALGGDGCAIIDGGRVICFDLTGLNPPPVFVDGALGARAFFASGSSSRVCVKRENAPSVCFDLVHPAVPTVREGEKLPPVVWLSIEGLQVLPADPPAILPRPQHRVPASATRVALSEHHGCAIVDGKVKCWGRASDGQLGDGTRYFHATPVAVPGLSDAVSLSIADTDACALKRSGSLVCWGGSSDHGQPAFTPTEVATSEPFSEVALVPQAGEPLLCARGASDWQCRAGEAWHSLQSPAPNVRAFKAGHFVTADNRSWEWGLSSLQLPPERDYFARIGLRVKSVAPDGRCAVSTKGELLCGSCGSCSPAQAKAQLTAIAGDFVDAASTVFDPVKRTDVVCALTKDAKVRCFQSTNDAFAPPKKPAPVDEPSIEALDAIVQLEAAGRVGYPELTCALSAAGAVYCWGSGESGQLGAASIAHRSSAQRIADLPRIVQIGVASTFACARAESGAVLCWGSNRNGSAPDGAPGERTEPVTLAWPGSASR